MTKNGSAVADIVNIVERGDRAAERDRERPVARARNAKPSRARTRAAPGPPRAGRRRARSSERRDAHDGERDRIDREREPQQPGRAERAADQRAGREAERARRLHQAVGARGVGVARRRGHERELGRLADRDAEAEQRRRAAAAPTASRR